MLTINNPTAETEEQIQFARQHGWKIEGQLEVGELGTPHYQLLITKGQQRISAVKKLFPTAHIEITRNVAASKLYVHKVIGRIGTLPEHDEKYPSMDKFWHLVFEEFEYSVYKGSKDVEFIGNHKMDWSRPLSDKQKLTLFDDIVGRLIEYGFHVEGIASSNLNRTTFLKFSMNIFKRCSQDRQTRQDKEDELAEIQECLVPMINDDDTAEDGEGEEGGLCSVSGEETEEDSDEGEGDSGSEGSEEDCSEDDGC